MTVTNSQAGANVHEIAAGVYRISTPVSAIPGGFTFNQILLVDDEPQIAQTLQLSVGSVRVLRHRALADLRGCLDSARGAHP
jgi:hypothetical protein